MDSIEQRLIPTLPPTITVRHFRRSQATELARRLEDINPPVFGLSIRLSSDAVESIALATSNEVFLLKIETGDRKKQPSLAAFDPLINLDGFTLAAFEMAHVALHIFRDLKQHLQGIDLSTLLSSSAGKPWQPSKFVAQKLCYDIRKADIDRLWEGDPECGFREVCLRAWLSAW